jgi:hypothetical protein
LPRIRTIKPEFVQSESLSRVSRDARLLFVSLWPFVDDSGRIRGNLRYLSSTLLPYDEDAPELIETWIQELESIGAVRRYKDADGSSYLDIPKWLSHQKIDKPTKSRLPAFVESSSNPRRILADSSQKIVQDLGPRTLDLGPRSDLASYPDRESTTDRGSTRNGADAPCVVALALPDTSAETFADFWQRWPNKTAKANALRSWRKVNPGPALLAAIHAALDWQLHQPKWTKDNGDFVPHASTWLNQRRWEDERPAGPRFESFEDQVARVRAGNGVLL